MIKTLTAWLDAFSEASPARRFWLAILAVLPFAALVGAYIWLSQPPYRTLYPRLSDQSGGEVMAALDQLDITYRLSENDGTIQVPANQLYAARYKLAARGLPKPDTQAYVRTEPTQSFGLSQFQEQLRYQHALEAELVRSIETLSAVASARVHLAMPKASPFLRDPPPVTAAVLLQLKPQQTLSREQVSAIQHMVAASVPRLKATDVSVHDAQGRLIGATENSGDAQGAALEATLTQRITQALSGLGAQTADVQMTATLTPDGRIQRLNGAVILAGGASADTIGKATLLAREVIGFDAQRGDSLSVIAVPDAPVAPPIKAPSAAVRTAAPIPPDHIAPEWLWTGGVLGVLLLLVLTLRKHKTAATTEAAVPSEHDAFETLLQTTRRQTLDNPRVTADVIRMWMQT